MKVNWSERVTRKDGRTRKFVTVFYTAEEMYFKEEIILWGSSSKGRSVMARGRSCYEFEYTLPNDLPSSFVSRFGNVSYSMEASLRLPFSRSDAVCIVPFTVNGILDLNVEPGSDLSYETRKYKSICCFCCTSGPVGFVFNMPRRGFVPGESIEFTAELNNQSSQPVYGMKVTLMQECKFHANGNSKTTLRPIRQVQGPQVGPGDSEAWIERLLRIPPIPPSRLATCLMIDVQYFLKVILKNIIYILNSIFIYYIHLFFVSLQLELTLPNMTLNLKEEVPITIGTIPLRNTFAHLNIGGSLMALPNGGPLQESSSKPSLLSISISDDAVMENSGDSNVSSPTKSHRPPTRNRGFSVSSEHPSFSEYPDLRKFCIACIFLQF